MALLADIITFRPSIGVAAVCTALLIFAAFFCRLLYNVFLHPLRKYPGPKSWAASRIPYMTTILSGRSHIKILQLHEKYGDVVRVAPDELSYISPQAWNDIMGHRKRGQGENGKDPAFWQGTKHAVISADRENHGRMRKILSHGFSAQSMMGQQPLIQGYVDLLIRQLRKKSQDSNPVELTSWYNWATFDIIGDLAFGDPFGCLDNANYHPWVSLIFDRIEGNTFNTMLRRFPMGEGLIKLLVPKKTLRNYAAHGQLTREKVANRLALKEPRPDFMEAMMKADGKAKLTHAEMVDNANILIIAGSETTATALSGATLLLTTHSDILAKATEEVRSTFNSEDEIDLLSVQKLDYMMAVLNETLRVFPPIPTTIPRKTQPGGDTICGRYVPEGTVLGVWQWPMYHSPKNFAMPDSFIPERWLGDPRFVNDKLEAFQPFSAGPRNCIGKNLAFAEMRLILAKILWNFELRIDPSSKDWLSRNKTFTLWMKPDLKVHFTERKLV